MSEHQALKALRKVCVIADVVTVPTAITLLDIIAVQREALEEIITSGFVGPNVMASRALCESNKLAEKLCE